MRTSRQRRRLRPNPRRRKSLQLLLAKTRRVPKVCLTTVHYPYYLLPASSPAWLRRARGLLSAGTGSKDAFPSFLGRTSKHTSSSANGTRKLITSSFAYYSSACSASSEGEKSVKSWRITLQKAFLTKGVPAADVSSIYLARYASVKNCS